MGIFDNKKIMFLIGSIVIFMTIVVLILIPRYPGCKPWVKPDIPTTLSGKNLIIILIDALRADHLGCYGYQRNTSPFIDSLAKQGMVFEKFFSNSSFTRESLCVLFTGRLPSSSGSTGWWAAPPKAIKSIGLIFKEAGYKTAIISNSVQVNHRNFRLGFDHFECLSETWDLSRTGPKLTAHALDFIKKNKDQHFMMYLHYLDPHGPYDPPSEFYRRFKENPYPHPIKIYDTVRPKCHELIKKGFGPGDKQFDDMILRYDAEIAHTDYSIELLFQGLKKENLLKNTVVLITADHGEEFLEHNYVEHAWTLYNESLHVPLILWAPGIVPHKCIAALVSTVDLLPTLVQLMGVSHQRKDLEGTPLFQYREDGFYFTPPNKPFIAELLVQHRNLIRTVIKGDWKYISAQKWLLPPQRPLVLKNAAEFEKNKKQHLDIWGEVKHEELYNLAADPEEKRNLLGKYEKKLTILKEVLRIYKMYCKHKGIKNILDDKNKETIPEKDRKILESLGYL
jgi:arylsulfatase A-like enzyme